MGNSIQGSNGYTVNDKDCSVNAHLLFNYLSQGIMLFTLWGTGAKHFVCKFCWKVWNWTNFTSQRKSKRILLYITLIITCEFIISSHVRSDRREMIKELFSLCELYCVYKRTIFHILFPPTCEVADHKKKLFNPIMYLINLSFYTDSTSLLLEPPSSVLKLSRHEIFILTLPCSSCEWLQR